MLIYLSHSANRREDPDWFIVEPRQNPLPQVHSLLMANRRVIEVGTSNGWMAREVTPSTIPWPLLNNKKP